jgi:hypothetical protein
MKRQNPQGTCGFCLFEKGEGKKMNRQFQLLEYPENVKKESV